MEAKVLKKATTKKLQETSEPKIAKKPVAHSVKTTTIITTNKKTTTKSVKDTKSCKPTKSLRNCPQVKSSPVLIPNKSKRTTTKIKATNLKSKKLEIAPQPLTELSKFKPNIRNENKVSKQPYEAWVDTSPAAVMLQRIKAENSVRHRAEPSYHLPANRLTLKKKFSPLKKLSPVRSQCDLPDVNLTSTLKMLNRLSFK